MEDKEIKEEISKEENKKKKFKTIGDILFTIYMTIMVVLIFITAQSKFTGKEPTLFNHRLYVVDSGSMSPTIPMDSMIIVKESEPHEIDKDDVITYYGHDKSSRITHRVVDVVNNGEFFTTRGDANEVDDPMPLEGKKLIGKVTLTIPFIGKVFRFLNTQIGMGILISLTILWIIVPIVSEKIKKFNKYVV